MPNQQKTGYFTFLAVYLLALFAIGNWFERHQTFALLLAFGSAFISYALLLQKPENNRMLFIVGIVGRAVLFLSLPSLSDDVYRFIWDGTLLKNGIHPFEALPSAYLTQNIEGIDQRLFDQLNSPEYFTIYPPLNQFIFWLSVIIGGENWLVSTNVIRVILLAADIGSFYLLRKLLIRYQKPAHLANWYFLNPLVVLEFVGNLHFEGLVIFFLLAGIYGYEKNKKWLSASGLGLAIGTKLLPLIYLPYLFFKGLREKKWLIAILAGLIGCASLLPLISESFIRAMSSSLDLYFRKFEFNASLYFIAREIGSWIYGYNNIALIGPLMSVLSLISILAISIVGSIQKWSISKTLLFVLTAYLLFATTIHPWYVLPLIAFGVLAGYWYPVIWSLLIFLTYVGYTEKGFELPMYLIVIEYVTTSLVLILELRFKKK